MSMIYVEIKISINHQQAATAASLNRARQ